MELYAHRCFSYQRASLALCIAQSRLNALKRKPGPAETR